MYTLKCLIAIAVLVLTSTAMGQYAEVVDNPPALEASGSEAIVYFVRPARMGGETDFWGFVDDILIGVTRGTNCVAGKVPTGERVVWSRNGDISALKIELEAGETYFFRKNVRITRPRPIVILELIDVAEAENVISTCQFKELTREGVNRGREILAANYEEAINRANE